MSEPTVAILAIGNEILQGDVVNSNTQWLARRLRARGATVVHAAIVRDREEEIARELAHAAEYRVRLIITTGGLGPTEDDRTVAAIAAALGRGIREDAPAIEQVAAFYQRVAAEGHLPDVPLSPARRKMGLLPTGAIALANRVGAAPGVLLALDQYDLLLLPGVPEEMADIFDGAFAPHLARIVGEGGFAELERFARISDESVLAPILRAVAERHPTAYVKSRAERYGRHAWFHLTISAVGARPDEAEQRAAQAEADLRRALRALEIEVADHRPDPD